MPLETLLAQGGFGIVAGVFLWLYLQERKDHKETRKRLETQFDLRREDASKTVESVTAPLSAISQTTKLIYDKLVVGREE